MIDKAGANRVLQWIYTQDKYRASLIFLLIISLQNWTSNIKNKINDKKNIIVSPDVGGVVRARAMIIGIGTDLANS